MTRAAGDVYLDRTPVGAWADEAACKGRTPIFFPAQESRGGWKSELVQQVKDAKALCVDCPVRDECLSHALANDEPHGIWGGLTTAQRRRLQGRVRKPAPIRHGTPGGYIAHRRRNEDACPQCLSANARYYRLRSADQRALKALIAASSCSPQGESETVFV